jgi:hypothetical protein
MYGQGRKPWICVNSAVLLLTDASTLCTLSTGARVVDLAPLPFMPPTHVTPEPYRWDQRVFPICFAMPRVVGAPPGMWLSL